jgi:hypothetical protein
MEFGRERVNMLNPDCPQLDLPQACVAYHPSAQVLIAASDIQETAHTLFISSSFSFSTTIHLSSFLLDPSIGPPQRTHTHDVVPQLNHA